MLAIIGTVLLVLWLVGFFAFHVGSVIHFALVAGIILVLIHFVRGRNTTA